MDFFGGILQQVIFSLAFATLTVLSVYWYMGKGFAFKLFSIVLPLLAVTSAMAIVITKFNLSSLTKGTIVMMVTSVTIGCLIFLYRITVTPLNGHSLSLQSRSAQLAATASQSASTAAEQSAMAIEMSSTVGEISQTSTFSSKNAQEIVKVAADALEKIQRGQLAVKEALNITARISKTDLIVDKVSELAEQSSLLALNASIEAAKSGEHGLGFAVVAAEVRKLSEQSNDATSEIRKSIELTTEVRHSIQTIADVVQDLITVLEDATERSRRIASSAMQQAAGIRQINDAAGSLSKASKDSAETAKHIEQAATSLEAISKQIRGFVGGKKQN